MADEQQREQESQQDEQGGGVGTGTAVKAAAAAAVTSVAAVAAKKALSHRGGSNGQSRNGGSKSGLGDAGSVLSSVLSSGWDAARDALVPAAEDAAGAAGDYLAKNGPDFVRVRIIPKFIDSFNEARGS